MKEIIYDLAIIGGGPAGMMSAIFASSLGLNVVLIEKNKTLGKKLLLTGGGRCNLTNAEFDNQKFLNKFKEDKKFLHSPFSKFSVKDTLEFFHKHNMETKVENEGRVFPLSNSSQSVFDVLVNKLQENKVTILKDNTVKNFEIKDNKITKLKLRDKKEIKAKAYILATGGKSHPETGSTGEGFKWLSEIGHNIIEPSASLVPIKIKDAWVKKISGVTLTDIKINVYLDNKLQEKAVGKVLFTHFGISGPTVLNMSKKIGELLKYGEVVIAFDLLPKFDIGSLDKHLQETFKNNQNKKVKNILDEIIPPALISIILEKSKTDEDKTINTLTKDERLAIVKTIKHLTATPVGLMGEDKAIITSGGLDLKEVNMKTMQSNKYENLFVVGDVLNIDRPSGGYSLQLCWTTGYVAGISAAEYLKQNT